MDPITTPALASPSTIHADAATEGATHLAKSAWKKIKEVLGWKDEPAPAEVKPRAEKTLTERPTLAQQIEAIVADYRQQVGSESVGLVKSKTSIVGQTTFQGDVTCN